MIGSVIDEKYSIVAELGKGGAGTVYKATQSTLKRSVAIKVLHTKTSVDQPLVREAKNLMRVQHLNIVKVMAVGLIDNERPYLVMEHIEGVTLDSYISSNGTLTEAQTIHIALQICSALDSAHRQKIIHRDLKSANIMLTNDSEHQTVKILDFGLSKNLDPQSTNSNTVTKTGGLVGSVAYMSPEVCSGQKADFQSDIYSLGCILYECLTGHVPFLADSWVGILHMHKEVPPDPIASENTSVSEQMEELVLKCLEKNPFDRFDSPAKIHRALEMIQAGKTSDAELTALLARRSTPRKAIGIKKTEALLLSFFAVAFVIVAATIARQQAHNPAEEIKSKPALEDFENAAERKKIRHSSQSFRLSELLGRFQHGKNDPKEVSAIISETNEMRARAKSAPALFVIYQVQGRAYHQSGRYPEAVSSFKQALINARKANEGKDSPQSIQSLIGIFESLSAMKQDQQAKPYLKQVANLLDKVSSENLNLVDLKLPILAKDYGSLNMWDYVQHLTYLNLAQQEHKDKNYKESSDYARKGQDADADYRPKFSLLIADNFAAEGNHKAAEKMISETKAQLAALEKEVVDRKSSSAITPFPEKVNQAAQGYSELASWEEAHGNLKEALQYYRKSASMADGSDYYAKSEVIRTAIRNIKRLEEAVPLKTNQLEPQKR